MPPLPTDIRLEDVSFGYEDFSYRTPIKFGGIALDRVTILNVYATVHTVAGKSARGFGSMPLGNVWSFPSRVLTYDETLAAMKALADKVSRIFAGCRETGHPIDLFHVLERDIFRAAEEVSHNMKLAEPIPNLCALVVASPFDAAMHDAFGKIHGRNCYETYGREFLPRDLGHYLGRDYAGEHLEHHVLPKAKPRMPLYHLIGALDPITDADIKQRINDGLPETLPEWIRADGLTHLKIKLNGDDLKWDVERVLRVDQSAVQTQGERGVEKWHYSLDFNERCANVGYLLEFLAKVKEQRPEGFELIQYIEQPTARDLHANRHNVMHEAAKLRPIVIDESLIDLESLKLAQELGYTGAALKACKGQSPTLLLAAAAQKAGMFLCVQDLTCPGASLIHSAGLAAHVPTVAAIESNARQYCPGANKPWEKRFPGMFRITDGTMETGLLDGPGLGAV
ncbi:MAG TPA: enolase C-terminal domain-like protein [Gemmataceae bacterium]|jgi:L-alanine-DL-glutamate epimerase-like enolase superfamily enzyme|nr:enolase C-terminal domain-like protein [Gemmataceae bacterium]